MCGQAAQSTRLHGDADKLVPLQQSELMVASLRKAGVRAELEVRKGAAHGWAGMDKDLDRFGVWFDETLAAPTPQKSVPAKP